MASKTREESSQDRILRFSLEVLKAHGAAGFSAPLVAEAASIRQSNITYYFPTRSDLLAATVDFALRKYEEEFEHQLSRINNFTLKKSKEFLTWLFTDSIELGTVRTFPEFWSLANTDKKIAKAVTQLYVDAANAVIKALGLDENPKKNQRIRVLLLVIGSVSEGLTATHGHRSKKDPVFMRTRDEAVRILAPLLFAEYQMAQRISVTKVSTHSMRTKRTKQS